MDIFTAQKAFTDGRKIIAVKPREKHPGYIILALFDGQYVTWCWDGESNQGYWGHYFEDFNEAVADFNERK